MIGRRRAPEHSTIARLFSFSEVLENTFPLPELVIPEPENGIPLREFYFPLQRSGLVGVECDKTGCQFGFPEVEFVPPEVESDFPVRR